MHAEPLPAAAGVTRCPLTGQLFGGPLESLTFDAKLEHVAAQMAAQKLTIMEVEGK